MKIELIRRYSNLQIRLGYLKLLAVHASRFPTTRDGLIQHLKNKFPINLTSGFALGNNVKNEMTYIGTLFEDSAMMGRPGVLSQNNIKEIIDLAQSLKIIDGNYSILEEAMPLIGIIREDQKNKMRSGDTSYNPMVLDQGTISYKEHAYFLLILLMRDLPLAFIPEIVQNNIGEFHLYSDFNKKATAGKGKKYSSTNLLMKVFRRFEEYIDENALGLNIENYNDWKTYFLGKDHLSSAQSGFIGLEESNYRMGKKSSYRHHATPRLEFLVDLEILSRGKIFSKVKGDKTFTYKANEKTAIFSKYVEKYLFSTMDTMNFVRKRFFDLVCKLYGLNTNRAPDEIVFKYFLRGYKKIKRDIGNTPAWSAAITGCLLALDDGYSIEISKMYEVANMARKQYGGRLRYSGGSRFDDEFLISIERSLFKELGIE
jgi:hypothetical protein